MCQGNQFIRNVIGIIGIITIFSHIISATLWITYLLGWRINRKLKYATQNQNLNNNPPTGRRREVQLNENGVNVRQPNADVISRQKLIWPVCSLRMSTQLIIFSMEITYILGCCTDLMRLIYLSITGDDLRLLFSEWSCRIQIFLSFTTCDLSGWHFVFLCIERCYITLFPRKYYSMSHSSFGPALSMIIFAYTISVATNIFLLIPTQHVCYGFYDSPTVNSIKFLFTLIMPVLIATISTIVMTNVLVKWKIKKMKSRTTAPSFLNSSTRNKTVDTSSTSNKSRPTRTSLTSVSSSKQKNNQLISSLRRGSGKLIVYDTSARITVAKMMLICALLYLYTLLSLFVFGRVYSEYCCFLTASQNCNWNDYLFNLLSIQHWTTLSLTSYVLMFGAVTIRQDIHTMLLFIWFKFFKKSQ
uniref:G_PROTEIN_RECEP_F1_2 domain-containing protein n=1 Tax=Trichobilharzia regenti TaxID=157069 RepID=A0AA85JGD2_TRIRE|nr:unnamed protein product [Trichobilharzia regenti]